MLHKWNLSTFEVIISLNLFEVTMNSFLLKRILHYQILRKNLPLNWKAVKL